MVTKEIKGNKGEWSELYVLLRLLADGKIHAANDKVEKINNIFFPIKKIIREDVEHEKYEYVVNNKIKSIEIFLNNA